MYIQVGERSFDGAYDPEVDIRRATTSTAKLTVECPGSPVQMANVALTTTQSGR